MLDVGLHEDIPPEEYHADPCSVPALSASIAKVLIEDSPAHAWLAHPRLGGKRADPTNDMDRGTLLHALLLNQGRPVVLVDAADWRTKAAKEARDQARSAGALPILKHKLIEAKDAAERIRSRLVKEWGIRLDRGKSEVVVVWKELADDGTEVLCRGQLDHLYLTKNAANILDLKCGGCAAPDFCVRQMVPMGYDIQRAAYVRAIESLYPHLAGRVEFGFAFCEADEPNAVTLVQAYGSLRELGERRWRRAVNTWARCLKSNEWPTYTRSVVMADAKPWDLEREDALAS